MPHPEIYFLRKLITNIMLKHTLMQKKVIGYRSASLLFFLIIIRFFSINGYWMAFNFYCFVIDPSDKSMS